MKADQPGGLSTLHENLPLTQIDSFPVLKTVLDWWVKVRRSDVPTFVDPLEIGPKALPNLILIDVSGGQGIVRLAGTRIEEVYGHSLRGLSLFNLFDEADEARVRSDLDRVCRKRMPLLTLRSYYDLDDRARRYVRLLLPIGDPGQPIARCLKAVEFDFDYRRIRDPRSVLRKPNHSELETPDC